ncbi:MAG: glutathione S-transferase family protein [Beijerinckiaceae bacterium]|nr:glutathione S-transferase family protein [Beijerinckiaceae bacterium]
MGLTLVIANKTYSSWSMRPWLLMRHFEIAFTEIVIPMDQASSKTAMLSHAPTGKCPALRDGDLAVWDSLAIIEYLAERHPEVPVWPRDRGARAVARSLAAEMHSAFLPLRRNCPMNMRRAPGALPLDPETRAAVAADVARIEAAWRDARQRFGAGGPFLFGGFSAADAMFAPVVNRFEIYDLAGAADTKAYMGTVKALPAWRDWQSGAEAEPWHLARIDAV